MITLVTKQSLDLSRLRGDLDTLRDSIVFVLIRRSRYPLNEKVYIPGGVHIPGFRGTLLDYLLISREKTDGSAGRWNDEREQPFFRESATVSRRVERDPPPSTLPIKLINRNDQIKDDYISMVRTLCNPGDQRNEYGTVALLDIEALQNISLRVHYGRFIAESKITDNGERGIQLRALAREGKWKEVREALRDLPRETKVLSDVLDRASTFGARDPKPIVEFFSETIIPLTIDVEVEYLRKRSLREIYVSHNITIDSLRDPSKIREECDRNIDKLVEIAERAFGTVNDHHGKKAVKELLLEDDITSVDLFKFGEEVIGFASYIYNTHNKVLYLNSVAINPDYQGYGLLSDSLRSTIKQSSGVRYLALHTQNPIIYHITSKFGRTFPSLDENVPQHIIDIGKSILNGKGNHAQQNNVLDFVLRGKSPGVYSDIPKGDSISAAVFERNGIADGDIMLVITELNN